MRRLLTLAALLLPTWALAHSADVVYVQVSGKGDGHVDELVTMTAATLGTLAPVDADGNRELTQAELDSGRAAIERGVWDAMPVSVDGARCARSDARAVLREGYVELDARFQCAPGELSQVFQILSVLPQNYRVVFASELGGARWEGLAQGDQQLVAVPDPRGLTQRVHGFFSWIGLGIVHILEGYDHLAFLLALLLVAGTWRQVLVLITAFTVAHSLTLSAGALGWIALDASRQRWAEAAIALSIVYVAAENLLLREQKNRTAVTFGFGLVHGLGFAAVLQKVGLGPHPVLGQVGFNLGVEIGQACLVLVLYPVVRILRRRASTSAWTTRLGSMAILAAGAYWLVDRLFV